MWRIVSFGSLKSQEASASNTMLSDAASTALSMSGGCFSFPFSNYSEFQESHLFGFQVPTRSPSHRISKPIKTFKEGAHLMENANKPSIKVVIVYLHTHNKGRFAIFSLAGTLQEKESPLIRQLTTHQPCPAKEARLSSEQGRKEERYMRTCLFAKTNTGGSYISSCRQRLISS